ncbi:MAG: hypothetical protein M3364_07825 [Actinomycetota bacterium]|nr:hypothetical protein [Actinomycetota bacterium]
MTPVLPELQALPTGLALDGELVAWKGSEPYFPWFWPRVLNRGMSTPLTFAIFDLLRHNGVDLTPHCYSERRQELEGLKLDGPAWTTSETFDDGSALFTAVSELGFEGVVAKSHLSLYCPNDRGWIKVKNLSYWRRNSEREAIQRSADHRARVGSRLQTGSTVSEGRVSG